MVGMMLKRRSPKGSNATNGMRPVASTQTPRYVALATQHSHVNAVKTQYVKTLWCQEILSMELSVEFHLLPLKSSNIK